MKYFMVLALLVFTLNLNAQDIGPKEIPNTVSAVKEANAGDYIVLPSGKRYILTREEIAIARGAFDYNDLSSVESKIDSEGREVKTISEGHTVYIFPNGQSTHIIKTDISFTAYMNHVRTNYYIAYFVDFYEDVHRHLTLDPPNFNVFRARVQNVSLSDGIDEIKGVNILVYNYRGDNMFMRFTSIPEMFWGNIPDAGSYKTVGETYEIEFDIE